MCKKQEIISEQENLVKPFQKLKCHSTINTQSKISRNWVATKVIKVLTFKLGNVLYILKM